MIPNLKSDDPPVLRWWIRNNVGKIAVQRHQNATHLLSLCDDDSVIGIAWNMFFQGKNIIPCVSKRLGD